jgi:hypothetical protein
MMEFDASRSRFIYAGCALILLNNFTPLGIAIPTSDEDLEEGV